MNHRLVIGVHLVVHSETEAYPMNQTSPKKLRAEMKDYLDHAEKEPVRIQRLYFLIAQTNELRVRFA